jgi:hypothetical protein
MICLATYAIIDHSCTKYHKRISFSELCECRAPNLSSCLACLPLSNDNFGGVDCGNVLVTPLRRHRALIRCSTKVPHQKNVHSFPSPAIKPRPSVAVPAKKSSQHSRKYFNHAPTFSDGSSDGAVDAGPSPTEITIIHHYW